MSHNDSCVADISMHHHQFDSDLCYAGIQDSEEGLCE